MSLSERLKVAEQARRSSEGAETDPAGATGAIPMGVSSGTSASIDLSGTGAAVVDLTDRPGAISYSPMRTGDGSSAFGEANPLTTDRAAGVPCPRCGGHTQLDLFDQVHQTASLSCVSCFHMFRIELGD